MRGFEKRRFRKHSSLIIHWRLPLFAPVVLIGLMSVIVGGASSALAKEPSAKLSLQQCIDLALKHNVDIQASKHAVIGSAASKRAVLGKLGPKVTVEGNAVYWDKEFGVSFFESDESSIDPTQIPPPTTPYETILAEMLGAFGSPISVRDQFTWSAGVTITQPLSPLYAIYLSYELEDLGYQANRIRQQLNQRNTIYRVTEGYLRVLQTKRFVAIAEYGLETLQAHLIRAQKFFEAELIGRNDLLKAELGLAGARQALLKAKAAKSLAYASLANVVGREIPETVELVDSFGEPIPSFNRLLKECQRKALNQRLELREIEKRVQQAETGKDLAVSSYIPSVVAVGNYTHAEGSRFQEEDAFFVGAMLNWDIWEWNSKYNRVDAASAKIREAKAKMSKAKALLALEVKKNFLDLQTARQSISVAETAMKSAEENLRIEKSRYEVHANTSTDVLDAQTAVQEMQSRYAGAYYDYLVALENLKKSMGAKPIAYTKRM